MLEKILLGICHQMSEFLSQEQLEKLRNILFINFDGKKIEDETYEIIPAEADRDEEMIKIFAASKKISGRSDSTIRQYVAEIESFREFVKKSFTDITTMDVRRYLGVAKEYRGNKMSTIQNKISYLNSFFSFLHAEGMINRNPMARLEVPKIEKIYEKPFSASDLAAIRKRCGNVRDIALIEFLYATGLRVSELCSLKVGDIDFSKSEFSVIGKGKKQRTVYISEHAAYYLNDYLQWRCDREGIGAQELKERPLFATLNGPYRKLSKRSVETLCRRIGDSAGVPNTHPHRFRRTFATDMLKRGMKIEELAKLMGHSKIDTTMVYCTVMQENVRNSYCKCA